MKSIYIILAILVSGVATAEPESPPTWLEDGVITVTTKNGKIHHFDTNKWKVVERIKRKKRIPCPEPKTIIKWRDKIIPAKPVDPVVTEKLVYKKNRISLLAGYGPIGLSTTVHGESTKVFEVEKQFGPITGLRYSRSFGPTWSASAEYLTNHTGTLGLGWSW